MDNDCVTPPLPLIWRCGELSRQHRERDAAWRQAPEGALEDVEKVVRRNERDIDALLEWCQELEDKIRWLRVMRSHPGLD